MSDETDEQRRARIERANFIFGAMVPHNNALKISILDYNPGMATMLLPYSAELAGDPETGVLHGGAITALVDAACGAAVLLKLEVPAPVATLDLRIDYLRAAEPGRNVVARADCHRLTRNVAFVRAVAWHQDGESGLEHAIATASGTFMMATAGLPVLSRASIDEGGKPS